MRGQTKSYSRSVRMTKSKMPKSKMTRPSLPKGTPKYTVRKGR